MRCVRPSGTSFLEWLEEGSSLARLQGLERYELAVIERRPLNFDARYGSERPKCSGSARLLVRAKHPATAIDDELRGDLAGAFGALDWRWERMGFHLQTARSDEGAAGSGSHLATELADDIRSLLPILGPINATVRRSKKTRALALERAPWRPTG